MWSYITADSIVIWNIPTTLKRFLSSLLFPVNPPLDPEPLAAPHPLSIMTVWLSRTPYKRTTQGAVFTLQHSTAFPHTLMPPEWRVPTLIWSERKWKMLLVTLVCLEACDYSAMLLTGKGTARGSVAQGAPFCWPAELTNICSLCLFPALTLPRFCFTSTVMLPMLQRALHSPSLD